jgi:hypothetical protein
MDGREEACYVEKDIDLNRLNFCVINGGLYALCHIDVNLWNPLTGREKNLNFGFYIDIDSFNNYCDAVDQLHNLRG